MARAEEARRKAEAKVAAVDQPLENPGAKASKVGHGHARHGYQTTDTQQAERIRTGIAPDGVLARAPRATGFRRPEDEAEAYELGLAELKSDLSRDVVPGWPDPKTGEKGFIEPGTGKPRRHTVRVRSTNPRGFADAAYIAKRGPDGKKVKDANGNLVPERIEKPQRTARVTFEYVASADEWRLLSYFPEE